MSPTDKLLLVFIHGFCGDDTTFGSFPEKICNDITKTITSVDVDKWIYDYNTKGDFSKAVKDFTDELIERINGDKKTAVILFGHSMGGLVAADAISVLKAASIPVLALLAYDTPFYGLSEGFIERVASMAVNNPLTDALSLAAKAISNNKWIVAAMVCGVAIAAYIFRDKAKEEIETLKNKIMEDVAWAKEYLEFASTLLKDQELGERMSHLNDGAVSVCCFYAATQVDDHTQSTFIKLPPPNTSKLFIPIKTPWTNEIMAHTHMFDESNPYANTLEKMTVERITQAISTFLKK